MAPIQQEKCSLTGKLTSKHELVQATSLRKNFTAFIQKEHPEFSDDSLVSSEALHLYRKKYLEQMMKDETGELDKVEKEVLEAISKHETVSEDIDLKETDQGTLGQRLADRVASFGGSWSFILTFTFIILIWIVLNSDILSKGFDPYPYILLNLILSCLAALQAPVIMMSQNRKETKDRKRSEYDYRVNLKAELEIRLLHEKIDHLMISQTQRLMELQQIQMDYLEEIATRRGK
ncbi:MAG: hypothetical protein DI538_22235 [Azospira oryzae]|jgi:uncharacterized membrane protein|nr:MAG: hypothetical protein DI538_22235 [Azospira oryzae]